MVSNRLVLDHAATSCDVDDNEDFHFFCNAVNLLVKETRITFFTCSLYLKDASPLT